MRRKDRVKLIRSILEGLVLLAALVCILRAFFVVNRYAPYDRDDPEVVTGKDAGFIAISFFGVDRTGTDTLISIQRLEEQLKALYDCGYVTVSQQDLFDYYDRGKPLPEKALFLIFEDGRTDTAIFSEPILEKFNFLGTICSYGENLTSRDSKFLTGKDLISLLKTTFWEMGTNGYRLSYINVFDRYNRFLGPMEAQEFIQINEYLGREYNHFLMDYIRDENYLPVETYSAMKERICYDYQLMEQCYTEALGSLPQVYILMHSNSDRFGNNERVSEVNEACIREAFTLNFNRESFAVNKRNTYEYDLTRLQSQAYWYTNHLLMRIWDDLDDDQKDGIVFVDGDLARKGKWTTELGVSEFKDRQIVLTSMPKGEGRMWLNGSGSYRDVTLRAELTGNQLGRQGIGLRCSGRGNTGILVILEGRELIIEDSGRELARVNLDTLQGVTYLSVEEDSRNALAAEYQTRAKNASSMRESYAFQNESNAARAQAAATVEDGAEAYIPELQLNTPGDRKLEIFLRGDRLTVNVDGYTAVEALEVNTLDAGGLCLTAEYAGEGYSQRNLSDDVYDAVFEDLLLTDNTEDREEPVVLYDDRLHGIDLALYQGKRCWNAVINWFITNL